MDLPVDWAGLAQPLTREDAPVLSGLVDLVKTRDRLLADKLIHNFIQKNYAGFDTLEGMGNLSGIETMRKELNESQPYVRGSTF